jgi:iron(III) transport system ATP-binding protein
MLTIANLVKTFSGEKLARRKKVDGEDPAIPNRIRAVDDVSIEVKEGEMFTLLGPSGCGKTTTLRSIAGLEKPDSGEIRLLDRVLFSSAGGRIRHVHPNQRGLGMVFQSYAIWPHMKVFDNVGFPLQVKARNVRPKKQEIRERVMRVLETMELAEYADRPATKLSGGQQQRLALARALITEPELMLLDEPLSNLDAKLRESLRFELKRFQRDLGITSIYVTHDQIEALALSSRIAVMRDGKIMQIGRPREIYEQPANQFVAQFIGNSNFMDGVISDKEKEFFLIDTPVGRLRAEIDRPLSVADKITLAFRPESVEMTTDEPSGLLPNEWIGEVVTRSFLGDSVDHIVRTGEKEILVRAKPNNSIPAGTVVTLRLPPSSLTAIPLGD